MPNKQQELNEALLEAVDADDASLVAAAIAAGADPKSCMTIHQVEGMFVIDYCAQMRFSNALVAIIESGVKPTSETMQYAVSGGDDSRHTHPAATFQICLAAGAPTNFQNSEGTLLHQAAMFNSPIVPELLLQGIRLNRINLAGDTALAVAIELQSDDAAVQLIDSGARIATINGDGKSALHLAIERKSPFVSRLITKFTANIPDPETGDMPILMALKSKQDAVARMLIAAGSKVDAADCEGYSTLHVAANAGSQIVQELIFAGADIAALDRFLKTPLMSAIASDYPPHDDSTNAALLLLKAEIAAKVFNPKCQDDEGNSWLHLAATGCNMSLVAFMIDDLKLDHKAKNNHGFTPVEMAIDADITALFNAFAARSAISNVIAAATRKAKL